MRLRLQHEKVDPYLRIVHQRFRRRREETAWKRRRIETSRARGGKELPRATRRQPQLPRATLSSEFPSEDLLVDLGVIPEF